MLNQDRVEAATKKLLAMWESGDLPEAIAHTLIQPKGDRPCDKWSLGNRILMLVNETLDARGIQAMAGSRPEDKKRRKSVLHSGPCHEENHDRGQRDRRESDETSCCRV